MAAHTSRLVTTSRYEVALPNPCTRADLLKAGIEAEQRYHLYTGGDAENYDTSFMVRATDEEIILEFPVKEEVTSKCDSHAGSHLSRAVELLAAITTDCHKREDGVCIRHVTDSVRGCYHAQARDFLSSLEETPHG